MRSRQIQTRPRHGAHLTSGAATLAWLEETIKTRVRPPLERLGLWRNLRRVGVFLENATMKYRINRGWRIVPEAALVAKLQEALSHLCRYRNPTDFGDYLEFGVFNGTSLSCAYQVFKGHDGLDAVRFFGFDSFEGLPDIAQNEDNNFWMPRQFRCDISFTRKFLTQRGVDWQRVFLIKGWFADTLTDRTITDYQIKKASLIMVDCDLYSSTREALRFCQRLIHDEAVILFDDWEWTGATDDQGEQRAFSEFMDEMADFEAVPLGSYSSESAVFLVVRKGLRRTEQEFDGVDA